MEHGWSKVECCELLGVNRQFYYRCKQEQKKREALTVKVLELVTQVRMRQPRLGVRKLYTILEQELRTLDVGRDWLFDILRANHMLIKPRRRYHVTTNSHHRFRKHKNLTQHLEVKRPEQLWVADITYIGTRQNPMYLALVTDAYSKKVVGYDVSNSLNAQGAIRALKRGLQQREYPAEALIHHSDRGLQYCCDDYQEMLDDAQVTCSMTEKYDPYQNAVAERVNGILKQEFIRGIQINDIQLMKKIIKQSIDIYNTERPHLSCRMKTPEYMHLQREIKIKTYKKENPPALELVGSI
ncbi:IS3 family transposase [Limibacter armeniacum]|uniref:IS3 family transposase n=1 Tax=Limibacter armeniacum TaxID=466084 RepID=UPI002FE62B1B